MIDHKVFIDRARNLQKPIPTQEQIDIELSKYNEPEVTQSWRNRIEVKIWDGVSNINSATPEYIMESNPWVDKVYMLEIDGKIVYMQTHEPYVEGHIPITNQTISTISDNHANVIASDLAKNEIIQAVMSNLNLND